MDLALCSGKRSEARKLEWSIHVVYLFFAESPRTRNLLFSQRSHPASTKSSFTRRSRILSHLTGPNSSK
jgi:hypothetical protein